MSTPYTERTDHHGNTFNVGDVGDFDLPAYSLVKDYRQQMRDVREVELNPDDVMLVGYPKTGMHWATFIIHMLMKGSTHTNPKTRQADIVFLDRDPKDAIPPSDKPRLLDAHLKFHQLPKQVTEKKVKLVYLERNPKDTWVSMYNHIYNCPNSNYSGEWNHFFDYMLSAGFWLGSWFDYVLDYERDLERERAAGLPIFVSYYEELKKDPVGQIEKLDQFLGYNRGRELCEQIAQVTHFSTLKGTILEEEKANKPGHRSQLIFYRKGEVGDWKNWFTVAQNERFDQVYNARMKGSKLRYTFE